MEFYNALLLRCGYDYSKTLDTTLRKWGFTEERIKTEYGEDVAVRLEVPFSMRAAMEAPLAEMRARSFLTLCEWNETPLVREKWR